MQAWPAASVFSAAEPERTDAEIEAVLLAELERLSKKGVRRVVWSNEAFMHQKRRILALLKRLEERGVHVRPIAYLRRHDERAISAYQEFGIKTKPHEGALLCFSDWLEKSADPILLYTASITEWAQHFPALELYNFDAIDDVSQHFFETVLGLSGYGGKRTNKTERPGLLTAWAVYNGSRHPRVMAAVFRRLAKALRISGNKAQPVPPLNMLMPNGADLEEVQARYREDFDQVNAMLTERRQPPLVFDKPEAPPADVSDWELTQMQLNMIFELQSQVLELKKEVKELRGQADEAAR